jgi:hypothetical protein
MRLKFDTLTTSISHVINHLYCAIDIATMVDSDFWDYQWRVSITDFPLVDFKISIHGRSSGFPISTSW